MCFWRSSVVNDTMNVWRWCEESCKLPCGSSHGVGNPETESKFPLQIFKTGMLALHFGYRKYANIQEVSVCLQSSSAVIMYAGMVFTYISQHVFASTEREVIFEFGMVPQACHTCSDSLLLQVMIKHMTSKYTLLEGDSSAACRTRAEFNLPG